MEKVRNFFDNKLPTIILKRGEISYRLDEKFIHENLNEVHLIIIMEKRVLSDKQSRTLMTTSIKISNYYFRGV